MGEFKEYATAYQLLYKDKNYTNETEQVESLLKNYSGGNINTILSIGCGTGEHEIAFASKGYDVTGIDQSEEMLGFAEKMSNDRNVSAKFEKADIRFYSSDREFDAVVSLFHVISYLNSNEDLVTSIKNIRRCLKTGGIFVFDTWYGPGVLTDPPAVRTKDVEDDVRKVIRIARPVMHDQTNVVDVNYEMLIIDKNTKKCDQVNESHHMRYFFRPEIEYILKDSGFELLDVLDGKNIGETNYGSWTAYFIARAV